MASKKRHAPKGKKVNPKYWVFCEGKTEKAYVEFLRTTYRLPIKIIPQIVGSRISEQIISSYLIKKEKHQKDKVFLLYDADVREVLQRLMQIKNGILLASNPSIELWFLFHYKNQTAGISSANCIRELSNRNRNDYKKGFIDDKLKQRIDEKQGVACCRAKKTTLYNNPSSNMYELIIELEKIKKNRS